MSKILSGLKTVSNTSLQQILGMNYSVLLGAYTFDDSTVKINDTSGYFRNGTVVNTLAIDTSNTDGSITRTNVLDFTDNTVSQNAYGNLSAYTTQYINTQGDITFSFWIRDTNLDTDWHALLSFFISTNDYLLIEISSSGKLRTSIRRGGVTQWIYDSTTTVSDNTWYYITVVITSNSNNVYINGVQDTGSYSAGSSAVGYEFSDFSMTNIYIGNFTGTPNIYEGYLDDLYILNKALSTNEIELLYTDTFSGEKHNTVLLNSCISNNVVAQSVYSNAFHFNPTGASTIHAIVAPNANTMNFYTEGSNRMQVSNTQFQTLVPLHVATGNTGAPSYSFVGDTDTGITGNGANEISFVVAGYTAMKTTENNTTFYPASNIHEIEFGTVSSDTAITLNRSGLGNRSQYNIRNVANPTPTSRYLACGYDGQNEIRMYYNGTLWVKGDGDTGGPPAYATDGLGGDGTRVVLFSSAVAASVYGLGINNTEMWYSVPSSASHKFYFGASIIPFEINTTLAFAGAGNSSYRIDLTTPGGETGVVFNGNSTGNYSRVDLQNVANATSTGRYFEIGFNANTNNRVRIYNNNAFTPAGNGNMNLGTSSLKWRNLYATSMVLSSPPYIFGQRTTQQSLVINTDVVIQYDSITSSSNPNTPTYSGGTFTIQESGTYLISYSHVGVTASSGDGLFASQINVNGSARYGQQLIYHRTFMIFSASAIVYLSASNTVTITGYNDVGTVIIGPASGAILIDPPAQVFVGKLH